MILMLTLIVASRVFMFFDWIWLRGHAIPSLLSNIYICRKPKRLSIIDALTLITYAIYVGDANVERKVPILGSIKIKNAKTNIPPKINNFKSYKLNTQRFRKCPSPQQQVVVLYLDPDLDHPPINKTLNPNSFAHVGLPLQLLIRNLSLFPSLSLYIMFKVRVMFRECHGS